MVGWNGDARVEELTLLTVGFIHLHKDFNVPGVQIDKREFILRASGSDQSHWTLWLASVVSCVDRRLEGGHRVDWVFHAMLE